MNDCITHHPRDFGHVQLPLPNFPCACVGMCGGGGRVGKSVDRLSGKSVGGWVEGCVGERERLRGTLFACSESFYFSSQKVQLTPLYKHPTNDQALVLISLVVTRCCFFDEQISHIDRAFLSSTNNTEI